MGKIVLLTVSILAVAGLAEAFSMPFWLNQAARSNPNDPSSVLHRSTPVVPVPTVPASSPTASPTWTGAPSETASPTPSATATPVTQIIWQNGTAGCWGGDCANGGVLIRDAVNWSTYTTASSAMEWTVTVGGFDYFEPSFSLQNPQNQSAFANGHLQFDVELGQPTSNYGAITVFAMGGSNMSLNLASVNDTSFTTVSFPLATLGTNGTGLLSVEVQFNTSQPLNAAIIYLNNIQWISN
ncbi:MAG TPA: hypothetical protein VK914_00080 [bacterium]|nr:hypothetical protein [bacterium]